MLGEENKKNNDISRIRTRKRLIEIKSMVESNLTIKEFG
jgi:hypothetical protein